MTTSASAAGKSVTATSLIIFVAALLFSVSMQTAYAQTDYGSLVAVVSMPTLAGSPAGITLTLVSRKTGSKKSCNTDNEGRCSFNGLEPGPYTLGVHLEPVKETPDKVIQVLIRFGAQMTQVINLSSKTRSAPAVSLAQPQVNLAPPPPSSPPAAATRPSFAGALSETVTPGRLGVSGTTADLEQLPNRNLRESAIFDLLPGTFSDAFGGISFNGQSASQNVLLRGGLAILPAELSTASFQDTGALLLDVKDRQSLKTYDSFNISTSNTPAKLGTGTGGQLLKDIASGEKTFKLELYEYLAHDAFSARNFFDFADKPALRFNLFGVSLAGPLFSKPDSASKLFAFGNYEGIRARSGNSIFEAAPSMSLRNRIAPVLVPILNLYRAGGAVVVDGSKDPNFEILRLDSNNLARKNAVTTRFDYERGERDDVSFIYLNSHSREDLPDGVTGRRFITSNASQTAILNYKRMLKPGTDGKDTLVNQFIFGFQSEPARTFASNPSAGTAEMSRSAVAIDGDIATTGIAGKPFALSIASPGNLLAGASDFNGTNMRFTPKWYSFVDQVIWSHNKHEVTFGGELRLKRLFIDQQFGTTYKFSSLDNFLADLATVDHSGDLGSLNAGSTPGARKAAQEYYIGYGQDVWSIRPNLALTYGLRYEYYSVLREALDRAVVFDPESGSFLPQGTPFYRSRKTNFLPRVSFAWAPGGAEDIPGTTKDVKHLRTANSVVSASFGMHVGPDTLDNILRPIFADRLRVTQDQTAFPADTNALATAFHLNEDNVKLPLRAISRGYVSPLRVYKFDATYKRALLPREVKSDTNDDDVDVNRELFLQLTYAGARGHDLLLRNFSNRIVSVATNPDPTLPAIVRREFDVVRDGQVLTPFDEIEYLTTGGISNYDSFQVNLKGRASKFLKYLDVQYTLARNYGNTDGDKATVGNPLDYDYDLGFNSDDVRHKFSFGTLFLIKCTEIDICSGTNNRFVQKLLGGWTIATIGSFQSGTPIDVRLKRPDVVYVDALGNIFSSPAIGRQAMLNVPGGGSSVAAYRPDLVPGVNPYSGIDRRFLNPAAFSIPAPGVLGNLKRGAVRGPGLSVIDLSIRKEISLDKENLKTVTFNVDITNVFNITNFKSPPAKLPNVLGMDASQNQLQPNQPFTIDAAGTFGILNQTAKRKADLGSSRQIQFGLSIKL